MAATSSQGEVSNPGDQANGNTEEKRTVYTFDELLAKLESVPEGQRPYACRLLTKSLNESRDVVRHLRAGKHIESIAAQDVLLLKWLKGIYDTVSALGPQALRYSQLELSIIKSGMVIPFITDLNTETSHMEIGVVTTDALCSTLSEIVRVAAAAYLTFWHYHNYRHDPAAIPSDDACLLFSTLAIKSLAVPATAAALEAQLQAAAAKAAELAAEAPAAEAATAPAGSRSDELLSVGQLRWLMHLVRSELCLSFAQVNMLMQSLDGCKENLVAVQQDNLNLIKQVPENPLGFVRYARSCLQFQQHRVAYVFADKGAIMARAVGDDIYAAQLEAIKAAATVFGGAAHKLPAEQAAEAEAAAAAEGAAEAADAAPAAPAAPATFSKSAVLGALASAQAAVEAARGSWLPETYSDLLDAWLQPEDEVLTQCCAPPAAEAEGAAAEGGDAAAAADAAAEAVQKLTVSDAAGDADSDLLPVMGEDVMYPTQAPDSLPLGALTQLLAAQQAAQAQQRAGGAGAKGAKGGKGAAPRRGVVAAGKKGKGK